MSKKCTVIMSVSSNGFALSFNSFFFFLRHLSLASVSTAGGLFFLSFFSFHCLRSAAMKLSSSFLLLIIAKAAINAASSERRAGSSPRETLSAEDSAIVSGNLTDKVAAAEAAGIKYDLVASSGNRACSLLNVLLPSQTYFPGSLKYEYENVARECSEPLVLPFNCLIGQNTGHQHSIWGLLVSWPQNLPNKLLLLSKCLSSPKPSSLCAVEDICPSLVTTISTPVAYLLQQPILAL